MEKEAIFEVVKEGNVLTITVVKDLTVNNAPALTEELSKYVGQNIEKIVFDATGLFYVTSAGLRVIFYAYQRIGNKPEIVFVNCPDEIRKVLAHVGLTTAIKFIESEEMQRNFRLKYISDVDKMDLEEKVRYRRQVLDNFEAHNDVVCETMRLGQEDDT